MESQLNIFVSKSFCTKNDSQKKLFFDSSPALEQTGHGHISPGQRRQRCFEDVGSKECTGPGPPKLTVILVGPGGQVQTTACQGQHEEGREFSCAVLEAGRAQGCTGPLQDGALLSRAG